MILRLMASLAAASLPLVLLLTTPDLPLRLAVMPPALIADMLHIAGAAAIVAGGALSAGGVLAWLFWWLGGWPARLAGWLAAAALLPAICVAIFLAGRVAQAAALPFDPTVLGAEAGAGALLVALMLGSALQKLDPALGRAAVACGAGPLTVGRLVLLPALVLPAIAAFAMVAGGAVSLAVLMGILGAHAPAGLTTLSVVALAIGVPAALYARR